MKKVKRILTSIAIALFMFTIFASNTSFASESDSKVAVLKTLTISEGVLTPDFDSSIMEYTVNNIPYTRTSIRIKPVAAYNNASITINNRRVRSGSQYIASLKTGENIIKITVTYKGEVNTYTLTVIREKNNNSNLKSLSVSPGKMDRRFSKKVTEYNLTVRESDNKITIIPVAEDKASKISMSITGNEKTETILPNRNKYEAAITDPGTYTIKISVTAENEMDKTDYTIIVNKPDGRVNTLSNIILSAGELDKLFDPSVNTYNVYVNYSVTKYKVEVKTANPNSSVKSYINGRSAGTVRINSSLKEGLNKIEIIVFSSDGNKTANKYTLNVIRMPMPDLSIIEVGYNNTTLSPKRISARDNKYQISFIDLQYTDVIKYVKVDSKYTSKIKFQNGRVVNLKDVNYILNDLSLVGLTDTGEQGVTVGILRKNADKYGYITVKVELIGEYEGHEISRTVEISAKMKEARIESRINRVLNSMKLNLNDNTSINGKISSSNTLTFDFRKIDFSNKGLYVLNATINVKRSCLLQMGNREIKLNPGDNLLTIEDFGIVDNGNDGVSIEFLKKLGSITQYGTLVDITTKGSPEYLIAFKLLLP